MIGTRTKRDHCSIQSIQRPEPQKANTNERHGYLHISSCPETNFMLQVANLKVENKILKSGICKTFYVLLHLEKKNQPARHGAKLRLTSLYKSPRSTAPKPIRSLVTNSDLLSQPNTFCIFRSG